MAASASNSDGNSASPPHGGLPDLAPPYAPEGGTAPEPRLPLRLYDELRAICAVAMQHERNDHTLQPTALAHEVYLRVSQSCPNLQDPRQFRIAASKAIRRILIEHARRRNRNKRGGAWSRVPLAHLDERAASEPWVLLELNDAIEELARQRPRAADVFEMTVFGGFQQVEIAQALGIGERTARDDWAFARAWLAARLADDDPS